MKDLSKKVTKPEVGSEITYPYLSLSNEQLPEIEDYDVGETIEAKVIMRVKNKNEREDENKKKEISASLDVEKCEVINKKESRKKADEHNFSKKDWDEIERKNKKENE